MNQTITILCFMFARSEPCKSRIVTSQYDTKVKNLIEKPKIM